MAIKRICRANAKSSSAALQSFFACACKPLSSAASALADHSLAVVGTLIFFSDLVEKFQLFGITASMLAVR
jgi:hypothetical protein